MKVKRKMTFDQHFKIKRVLNFIQLPEPHPQGRKRPCQISWHNSNYYKKILEISLTA
ncbi:MAG: hypothetical protein UMU04_06105 [Halanaerobiales bacterium]|nr:hypothetical protein [Halanaerobiales bacterium]